MNLELLGRREDALALCHEVRQSRSTDVVVLSHLAAVYKKMGMYGEITEVYEAAHEDAPSKEEVAQGLLQALASEGRLQKQQSLSLKLYREYSAPMYLHSAVASIVLQVAAVGPHRALDLAEVLLQRLPVAYSRAGAGERREAYAVLLLHIATLRQQGKYNLALELVKDHDNIIPLPTDAGKLKLRLMAEAAVECRRQDVPAPTQSSPSKHTSRRQVATISEASDDSDDDSRATSRLAPHAPASETTPREIVEIARGAYICRPTDLNTAREYVAVAFAAWGLLDVGPGSLAHRTSEAPFAPEGSTRTGDDPVGHRYAVGLETPAKEAAKAHEASAADYRIIDFTECTGGAAASGIRRSLPPSKSQRNMKMSKSAQDDSSRERAWRDGLQNIELERSDNAVRDAFILFRHVQRAAADPQEARVAHLAELEMRAVAFACSEWEVTRHRPPCSDLSEYRGWPVAYLHKDMSDFLDLLIAYFSKQAHLGGCYADLKPYLVLLDERNVRSFLHKVQRSMDDAAAEQQQQQQQAQGPGIVGAGDMGASPARQAASASRASPPPATTGTRREALEEVPQEVLAAAAAAAQAAALAERCAALQRALCLARMRRGLRAMQLEHATLERHATEVERYLARWHDARQTADDLERQPPTPIARDAAPSPERLPVAAPDRPESSVGSPASPRPPPSKGGPHRTGDSHGLRFEACASVPPEEWLLMAAAQLLDMDRAHCDLIAATAAGRPQTSTASTAGGVAGGGGFGNTATSALAGAAAAAAAACAVTAASPTALPAFVDRPYMLDALCLLEVGARLSPSCGPLRLLLSMVYGAVGATIPMRKWFDSVGSSQRQLQGGALSMLLDRLMAGGSFDEARELCRRLGASHAELELATRAQLARACEESSAKGAHRSREYLALLDTLKRNVTSGRRFVDEAVLDLIASPTLGASAQRLAAAVGRLRELAQRPVEAWAQQEHVHAPDHGALRSLRALPRCTPLQGASLGAIGAPHLAWPRCRLLPPPPHWATAFGPPRRAAEGSSLCSMASAWPSAWETLRISGLPPVPPSERNGFDELMEPGDSSLPGGVRLRARFLLVLHALLQDMPDEAELAELLHEFHASLISESLVSNCASTPATAVALGDNSPGAASASGSRRVSMSTRPTSGAFGRQTSRDSITSMSRVPHGFSRDSSLGTGQEELVGTDPNVLYLEDPKASRPPPWRPFLVNIDDLLWRCCLVAFDVAHRTLQALHLSGKVSTLRTGLSEEPGGNSHGLPIARTSNLNLATGVLPPGSLANLGAPGSRTPRSSGLTRRTSRDVRMGRESTASGGKDPEIEGEALLCELLLPQRGLAWESVRRGLAVLRLLVRECAVQIAAEPRPPPPASASAPPVAEGVAGGAGSSQAPAMRRVFVGDDADALRDGVARNAGEPFRFGGHGLRAVSAFIAGPMLALLPSLRLVAASLDSAAAAAAAATQKRRASMAPAAPVAVAPPCPVGGGVAGGAAAGVAAGPAVAAYPGTLGLPRPGHLPQSGAQEAGEATPPVPASPASLQLSQASPMPGPATTPIAAALPSLAALAPVVATASTPLHGAGHVEASELWAPARVALTAVAEELQAVLEELHQGVITAQWEGFDHLGEPRPEQPPRVGAFARGRSLGEVDLDETRRAVLSGLVFSHRKQLSSVAGALRDQMELLKELGIKKRPRL